MNPRILIPLTLASLMVAPGVAGAQTPDQCQGTAAFNTLPELIPELIEGDTYSISFDRRPGCQTVPVCLADHITKTLAWDPTEVQPLGSSVCTNGPTLTFTVAPHPDRQCLNHQLDLITDQPLPTVDSGHRYNETAIGGSVNRLITVAYVESATDVCGQHPDPTTTTTDTPPATIEVYRTTPEFSTTTTPPPSVVATTGPQSTIPPVTAAPDVELFTATSLAATLPVTGAQSTLLRNLGAVLTVAGAVGIYLAANLPVRRRNRKENQ